MADQLWNESWFCADVNEKLKTEIKDSGGKDRRFFPLSFRCFVVLNNRKVQHLIGFHEVHLNLFQGPFFMQIIHPCLKQSDFLVMSPIKISSTPVFVSSRRINIKIELNFHFCIFYSFPLPNTKRRRVFLKKKNQCLQAMIKWDY